MIEQRFLEVATSLCQRTGRRPREAFMRRAASTAYYALFHAVARMCANTLIGSAAARTAGWKRVYRSLDHAAAKRVLKGQEAAAIDPKIVDIGLAFAELQERRHQADYDPSFFGFFFDETRSLVDQAEAAIADLWSLRVDQQRDLATLILLKPKGGS